MTNFKHDKVLPYENSSLNKKEQVEEMFNSIAFRYDFLNRFLSGGSDVRWRKKAINELKDLKPQQILDVATGTADMAIACYQMVKPKKIIGIDISQSMLEIGTKKIEKAGLQNFIELHKGDSEILNYSNNFFDAVMVAFGVRNFANLEKGLTEMLRVLKPGGKLIVLEFSKPKQKLFKSLCDFYMNYVTPQIGNLFTKNKKAYEYLNNSVQAFPERESFLNVLNSIGYRKTYYKALSFGICSIYCGEK